MNRLSRAYLLCGIVVLLASGLVLGVGIADEGRGDEVKELPKALIDGTGSDWRMLTLDDFVDVNGDPDTWTAEDGIIRTLGLPMGVKRTRETFTNFELVVEWRHLEFGGNSGMFLWVPGEALEELEPGVLPDDGIEIQMLDHRYIRLEAEGAPTEFRNLRIRELS